MDVVCIACMQARTVTRIRDASGREKGMDNLRNLSREEAQEFDAEWARQAKRSLPGGSRVRSKGTLLTRGSRHSNHPGIREA